MKVLLSTIAILSLFIACDGKQKADASVEEVSETTEGINELDSTTFLGEAFEIEQVVAVNELQTQVAPGDSAVLVARGKVLEVCQAKGCWMTIEMPDQQQMRVSFKDYAFFMPKDLAGKEVIMKGVAQYTTTDVATLQHLAADAGKPQSEIDEITTPENALSFLASGVTIVE